MEKLKLTHTRGNVIVEHIEIGDIHYEYDFGCYIEAQVISKPELDSQGNYNWQSLNTLTNKIIDYMVNPAYANYSAKLYDYMAYKGANQI